MRRDSSVYNDDLNMYLTYLFIDVLYVFQSYLNENLLYFSS